MQNIGASIDSSRLLEDLRALAQFGRIGNGVSRVSYSQPDGDARIWLMDRMRDASLDASIDTIGNVYGRSRATNAILIGSHTDSVPNGGWLDGSLGVAYALEIARRSQELQLPLGVDVISFIDEEGTYLSWLGSRSFCSEIKDDAFANVRSESGIALTDALNDFARQMRAANVRLVRPFQLDASHYAAFLEAHIEQGPRLEAEQKQIGVVTSIVGIRNQQIHFTGRADHAGTTPMEMRRDAGAALIHFATSIEQRFREMGTASTVWNFGHIQLEPGRRSVVPGAAELSLQYRDRSSSLLASLDDVVEKVIEEVQHQRRITCEAAVGFSTEPVQLDDALSQVLSQSAAESGASWIEMPSGAGHDAAALARHLPTAMLFVPSIDGRSHTEAEDTAVADIVTGCRVLLAAVVKLARGRSGSGQGGPLGLKARVKRNMTPRPGVREGGQ